MVKGSLIFFPVFWVLIWLTSSLGFWTSGYLALLVQLLPAMALAQLPLVQDDEALPRIPMYLSSALLILGIGSLGLVIGRRQPGFPSMGLARAPLGQLLLWTGALTLTALLLLGGFFLIRRALGIREAPILTRLLPRTSREKAWFAVLSLSAGVGEEIAYRGFLIPILSAILGWAWGAALLASVVFGLLHAYQGWLGIFRTAILGMVLAGSFLLTGSLWPAILSHAFLDVLAGIVLGDTLLTE